MTMNTNVHHGGATLKQVPVSEVVVHLKFDWRSVQTVQLCPNRLHVGDLVTASQGFPDCQDPVRGLQSIA